MAVPSDEEIRSKVDAKGVEKGVMLLIGFLSGPICLTRYEAYRFSRFLEDAIHESCRLSREKIDGEFEHGREG